MGGDEGASVRYATVRDASQLSSLGARTFRAAYTDANGTDPVDAYVADHYSAAIQLAELRDDSSSTSSRRWLPPEDAPAPDHAS